VGRFHCGLWLHTRSKARTYPRATFSATCLAAEGNSLRLSKNSFTFARAPAGGKTYLGGSLYPDHRSGCPISRGLFWMWVFVFARRLILVTRTKFYPVVSRYRNN
jgi:hypothetical protein